MTSIPSDLAVQIPRKFLEITTNIEITVLQEFNKKKWKPEQVLQQNYNSFRSDNIEDPFWVFW